MDYILALLQYKKYGCNNELYSEALWKNLTFTKLKFNRKSGDIFEV